MKRHATNLQYRGFVLQSAVVITDNSVVFSVVVLFLCFCDNSCTSALSLMEFCINLDIIWNLLNFNPIGQGHSI